ncbi:MAG TPA: MASE1 domain-containing protein [Candidatus Acidoferrum sp.]
MIPERRVFFHHSSFVPSDPLQVAHSRFPFLSHLAALSLLTLIYYASGRFGLGLASVNPHATVLWAPTGISIAALLLLGYRAWPAVLAGAFLVNHHTDASIAVSAGIAVGNTLEAFVGAYLVNQFANGTKAFYRTKDVFRFVCLAGFLASAVSATIGVCIICGSGFANWHDFLVVWRTWWIGDVLGALAVTPFIVLVLRSSRHSSTLAELLELFLLLAGLSLLCAFIFGPPSLLWSQWYGLAFLCLPFSVWAAFRFCPLESAGTNLVLSGFVIWGSLSGFGPFASGRGGPLLLGTFVSIACIMPLMIAASVCQRRRVEEELLGLHSLMQAIVDEKTALLQQTVDALHTEVVNRMDAERSSKIACEPFQQIAAALPDVLWLIDVIEERILYVSPAYENIWGRSCQSLYTDSHSWLDAVHPDDNDRALVFLNRDTSADTFDVQFRIRRTDGAERWIHDRGYAIRDSSGRVVRVAGRASDITETKILELSLR